MTPVFRDPPPLGPEDAPEPAPAVDCNGAARENIADSPNAHRNSPDPLNTPTTAEHGCARIPQELVDLVLDCLWDNDCVLCQCILVCRTWHMYVIWRKLLSGTLRLSTAAALAALVKSMPFELSLWDVHTAHLTEASSSSDTTPWLHRALLITLPSVKNLYLRKWRPAHAPLHPLIFIALSHFRGVGKLILEDCAFASVVQLQHLLVELPQLFQLGLVGVHVPTGRSGTARQCKPPPRLIGIWLGHSRDDKARPGEDEENVAGYLAEWFAVNEAKLEALQLLSLRVMYNLLREGELASLGRFTQVVGPRIQRLEIDFVNPPSDPLHAAASWHEFKLECCTCVQILGVFGSTPALQELALLSPECRVRVLQLRRWHDTYDQKTDWAGLPTAFEGDAFADLQKVVNTRLPQSGEVHELEAFVECMHARRVDVHTCGIANTRACVQCHRFLRTCRLHASAESCPHLPITVNLLTEASART